MPSKPLFTAQSHAVGGRDGHVQLASGPNLELRRPDSGENGSNPEELFAAGYAACFQSALSRVARRRGADTANSRITALVTLNLGEQQEFFLSVVLRASLPGVDPAAARELLHEAHGVCPYSRAVHGNVDVRLELEE